MIRSRYLRILWFFGRVILGFIGWEIILPRLGLRRLSRANRSERLRRIAVAFRGLALEMGGVMIKGGQFLSTRLDVLPKEITDELTGLQDEVQPEPFTAVRRVIESEMGGSLEDHFARFEPAAMAAASIGQVHRAWIKAGDEQQDAVVVKVQRPNIRALVDTDVAAIRVVSRWVHAYPPIRRRVDTPALIEEFSRTLYEEIDYLREGKNAEMFAQNFASRPRVCVPKVIWSHTTARVLCLEEVQGIKITDYAAIEAAGIPRAEVAEQLIDQYLKQIFEDHFFHADPHPGNLFVARRETGWQLIFVDFGMTGTIPAGQITALREMLIAVGTQDIPRLIRSYQLLGLLLPNADTDLLEKATRSMFQRFWGKSTTEIMRIGQQEALQIAGEFRELLYQLPFQVPDNLIYLVRCLSILSGICTGLNPAFNVWESVMPYARKLVEDEGGSVSKSIVNEAVSILQVLAGLPARANNLLQRVEQGRLEVQTPDLRAGLARIERGVEKIAGAVIFAAFLLGAVQLFLAGFATQSTLCLIAAAATLLWVLLRR